MLADQQIPQLSMPQSWTDLIRNPSTATVQQASKLCEAADSDKGTAHIERLAHQELHVVGEFLAACPAIEFFFVGWDHRQFAVVQRAGPDKRRVRSMLKWDSKWRGRRRQVAYKSSDAEVCERTWQAVQSILDLLNTRKGITYLLLWRLDDQVAAEFDSSLDMTAEQAWNAIRLSLTPEDRDQIPVRPPPSPIELSQAAITPVSPSVWEPDPATIPNIPWHEYQQHNFARQPDWRWTRSWSLLRHGRYYSKRRDDPETGEATRFLRALVRAPQDRESIITTFPAMFVAHQIRTGPRDRSLELEARVLARQSPEEIARRLAVPHEAVEAYGRVFFNVVDRLDSKTYIVKQIIGTDWALGPRPLVLEGLLKAVAYYAGPAMLDRVLPYLRNAGHELDRRTAGEAIQDPFAERLNLLIEAASLPLDRATRKQLVRCYPDLLGNLPRHVPRLDLIGGVAHIMRPFDGILGAPSMSKNTSKRRAA